MPRLVNVAELLKDFSRKSRKERTEAVKKLDGDLKEAVRKDMAVHFGVVMSTIANAGKNPRAPLHHGEHGVRVIRMNRFAFWRFGFRQETRTSSVLVENRIATLRVSSV